MMESGQQYEFLTAIEFSHRSEGKKKHHFWRFKCICGQDHIASKEHVQNGKIKSCGCKRIELIRTNQDNHVKKPLGESGRNALFADYRCRARRKGYSFELTIEQFESLTKGNCTYCGIEPRQQKINWRSNGPYIYNGIDRIDNTKGYSIENCTSCCEICNRAKRVLTLEAFHEWITRLIEHQRRIPGRDSNERQPITSD